MDQQEARKQALMAEIDAYTSLPRDSMCWCPAKVIELLPDASRPIRCTGCGLVMLALSTGQVLLELCDLQHGRDIPDRFVHLADVDPSSPAMTRCGLARVVGPARRRRRRAVRSGRLFEYLRRSP